MGQRVSKQEVKTPHFFFGEVAVRNDFNKEMIVVFKNMMREDEYDDWQRGYKVVNQMNKDSLLVADNYEKEKIKKYFTCCECPADHEMSIVFERFDLVYKTELAKREKAKPKMQYRQEELFVILYEFAIGIKEFQVKGLKFGDIRPSQMVVTASKKIKMINLYSFPWELTSIDKILEKYDKTTKFYLAPEEIEYVSSRSNTGTFPNPKTEAFSLGLTILEAAILQNSQQLYTVNPRAIDLQLLQKKVNILKQKYPNLALYVEKLLATKPENRFSCGELWSALRLYSQSITQFKKFTPKQSEEHKSVDLFRKSGR